MTAEQKKYYVIEVNYVGPNDLFDPDHIGIYTMPVVGNLSGEPVIEGWAGTTGDWARYGRGAFDSLEEARARIEELYPDRREEESGSPECLEVYRLGELAEMTRALTADWLSDAKLTGKETDEDLAEIIDIAEANVNDAGMTLHPDALEMLAAERDRARDEDC